MSTSIPNFNEKPDVDELKTFLQRLQGVGVQLIQESLPTLDFSSEDPVVVAFPILCLKRVVENVVSGTALVASGLAHELHPFARGTYEVLVNYEFVASGSSIERVYAFWAASIVTHELDVEAQLPGTVRHEKKARYWDTVMGQLKFQDVDRVKELLAESRAPSGNARLDEAKREYRKRAEAKEGETDWGITVGASNLLDRVKRSDQHEMLEGLYRSLYPHWSRSVHGLDIVSDPFEADGDNLRLRRPHEASAVETAVALDSLVGITLTFLDSYIDRHLPNSHDAREALDSARAGYYVGGLKW